ncbi:hypothetical protein GJAV_G00092980 [Gymnothorax javanicus]|nr:hypothetical protein GJAV_G00092980 [Gymnothorax javanicus]
MTQSVSVCEVELKPESYLFYPILLLMSTRGANCPLNEHKMSVTIRRTLFLLFCDIVYGTIAARNGENVVIRCPALEELHHIKYRAVSWYRVYEDHFSGIIHWDRRTNTLRWFVNMTQDVTCPSGDGLTLELQNITAGDSGVYRCSLWAPIGYLNRDWDIRLTVKGYSDVEDSFSEGDIWLYIAGPLLLFGFTITVLFVYCLKKQVSPKRKDHYEGMTASAVLQVMEIDWGRRITLHIEAKNE